MRNMTDLLVCRNVRLAVWMFPVRKLLENKADKWMTIYESNFYFSWHAGLKKGAIYDYPYYVWVICTRDLLSVIHGRFQRHLRLFGLATNPCSSLDSVWSLNGPVRFETDCTELAAFLSTSLTGRLPSPILGTQWSNVNRFRENCYARSVGNQFVIATAIDYNLLPVIRGVLIEEDELAV